MKLNIHRPQGSFALQSMTFRKHGMLLSGYLLTAPPVYASPASFFDMVNEASAAGTNLEMDFDHIKKVAGNKEGRTVL
jgi:hypothetical protein